MSQKRACDFGTLKIQNFESCYRGKEQLSDSYTGGRKILENGKES